MVVFSGVEMIKFVLMVNRQGQTRLSRYYQPVELGKRAALEADVVRGCLYRKKEEVSACIPISLSLTSSLSVCRSVYSA